MRMLRFQEGVSWAALGGNPAPPEQTRPDDLARSMENDLHMRPSVVGFIQKAVALAEHDPHRALDLADQLMARRSQGGFPQPLSPNELIAVHELQGTALTQGLSAQDIYAYRSLLLAKPSLPALPPNYHDGFERRR